MIPPQKPTTTRAYHEAAADLAEEARLLLAQGFDDQDTNWGRDRAEARARYATALCDLGQLYATLGWSPLADTELEELL